MRNSFLAAAAVLALTGATAMAQDAATQNETTKTNPHGDASVDDDHAGPSPETKPRHALGDAELH